ncbi:hypothetical protein L228DRAFT_248570 [Xylona heveae TC161]|uniref:Uncharacterized protein n=1 Tax=Xylona heveae (strain CBS 132557 / TC161) TaxID=1328760 RepID=A0A165G746_XYLHT|nr:hypothetical protein L228DRAFT_248570 [Xylona heveae TC161]KZF21818.1 hypothetical protein L228DRAFT_248570 [Xylona heveae TC161]
MADVLKKIIPLILLLLLVIVLGFVGFVVYSIANDIAQKTSQHMEKKNVSFTKDGLKVGIKEMKNENYVDKTQSYLVKAWNYSTWPAYKSRFWNKQATENNGQQQSRPEARRGHTNHGKTQ